jgi:hypothetical protein
MKSRLIRVAATTFVLMVFSIQLAAQQKHTQHHHYKLFDLGSFGARAPLVAGSMAMDHPSGS